MTNATDAPCDWGRTIRLSPTDVPCPRPREYTLDMLGYGTAGTLENAAAAVCRRHLRIVLECNGNVQVR